MVKYVRLLITLVVVIAAYWFNNSYLFINNWVYTGILLLVWIAVGIVAMLIGKVIQKKTGKGEPYAYVFPDTIAKGMKNMDMRTQYEAGLLSSFMIMIGIAAFAIYFVTFYDVSLAMKILTAVNAFFGVMFMASNLVTIYQQYVTYMEAEKAKEEMMATGEMLPLDIFEQQMKGGLESENA